MRRRYRFAKASRKTVRKPGQMNKWESEYASQVLEPMKKAGEILDWAYEVLTLKLAPDTRYTPDFFVIGKDGVIELHEVKGFFEDDAKVKWKVGIEAFPFRFVLVQRQKKRDGGNWIITPHDEAA